MECICHLQGIPHDYRDDHVVLSTFEETKEFALARELSVDNNHDEE